MKEIVVISGKGGTGKTSIVASFAVLSQNAVIADCDVDAADLHLVLNPAVQITESFSGGKIAEIIPGQCINCDICKSVCRFDAISVKAIDGLMNYIVDPISCEGCGVCVAVCPEEAVLFESHENGKLFVSETDYGSMVHARMGFAEENSGKLVSLVRARAKAIAEYNGQDLIIVDGPPGVGCPVISSITGAHAVLIVTEPTVSGVHDLERVVKLTDHFNIPTYICINKHDINPAVTQEIENRAKSLSVAVLGKIHYDPVITEAQIHAVPVVTYCDNGVSKEIQALWYSLYGSIYSNRKELMGSEGT
ncbi:ATP-binding protein [Candidatus Neomarinimicrobiota bacterium]